MAKQVIQLSDGTNNQYPIPAYQIIEANKTLEALASGSGTYVDINYTFALTNFTVTARILVLPST